MNKTTCPMTCSPPSPSSSVPDPRRLSTTGTRTKSRTTTRTVAIRPSTAHGRDGEDEGKHVDPGTHGDLTSFNIEQSLCNPKVSLLASRRSLEAAIIPPLNDEQVANYWRDGHLAGIDILTPEQTSLAYQRLAKLEAQEIAEDADRWASEEHQPCSRLAVVALVHGHDHHPTIIAAVGACSARMS